MCARDWGRVACVVGGGGDDEVVGDMLNADGPCDDDKQQCGGETPQQWWLRRCSRLGELPVTRRGRGRALRARYCQHGWVRRWIFDE
jgi:hypothetical protein